MSKSAPRQITIALFLAACSAPAPAPQAPAPAPPPVAVAAPAPEASEPVAPPPPPAASAAPAPPPPPSPCPEGMAFIPAGDYVMGASKAKVSVKAFCLDVYETTADEYAACVKTKKCEGSYLNACAPSTYNKPGSGKMPMVCVDFKQAESYCGAQKKRLPSIEEWEWAARGAGEKQAHPWGAEDPADQVCWSGKTKREGPCEVGSFPAGKSPQGVHDLIGGTGEWTTSKLDATSSDRIGRGGSWRDSEKAELAVERNAWFKATYRCGFLGIRCAAAVP